MKLLDAFCCQGGATYGYKLAGFEVTGVDIKPQPKYPEVFIQHDAIDFILKHGKEFNFIHASPPCQKYSMSSMQFRVLGKKYIDLVDATRAACLSTGVPYTLENVPNAPLNNPITLCGTMFDLPFYRHRLFESNWPLFAPFHPEHIAPNAKMGRPIKPGEFIQYVGHFPGVQYVREITGQSWMDQYGLAQSIPPHYTKYIGQQFKNYLACRERNEPYSM